MTRALRRATRVFVWTLGLALGAAAAILLVAWLAVPDVSALATAFPERTSYMVLQAAERGLPDGGPRLAPLPLAEVSPLLGCAIVKAEDRTFFEHQGFIWQRLKEAARATFAGAHAAGGSTITQQLARNLYLSPDRSLWRKLREAFIADRLERVLGKRRILELYLNCIEWGDGLWGVGPAAARLLGKPAGALDAFEGSLLASLVAAPRAPLQGSNLLRAATVQRRVVLQLARSRLMTSPEEARDSQRGLQLWTAVSRGATLEQALPTPVSAPVLPLWEDVLESGCGLEAEFLAVGIQRPVRVQR